MKPEDKAKVMETLTALTKSITKLQAEIKAFSSGNAPKVVKSKAQVGLGRGERFEAFATPRERPEHDGFEREIVPPSGFKRF